MQTVPVNELKNPALRAAIGQYREISDDFLRQVGAFGLPFAENREEELASLRAELRELGVRSRNDGASLVYGELADACEVCRTGDHSFTGVLSLMCHRNCFFCFNPNQEEFEHLSHAEKDWARELRELKRRDPDLRHIALTGGEPLLHREDLFGYFRTAKALWPEVSMRLYTSGDLLDEAALETLRDLGLDEIRFSLKPDELPSRGERVWTNLELAVSYLPRVLVEMPVLPDTEADMLAILDRLEELGAFGINLLELCFPFHNAEEFLRRGYALRNPPYRTLYNFWYAGGLAIDGSELLALRLLRRCAAENRRLNVHYCSLENKHFGQVWQQNRPSAGVDPCYVLSERDFYLKTVKAYGKDVPRVERLLRARQRKDFATEPETGSIRFSPACAELLKKTDLELAVSRNIVEARDGAACLRELKLEPVRASEFDAVSL